MPQVENGYVRIASELMDAFCRIRIPGQQMQCLLFIIRKTYGFNKKEDAISLGQFSRATGINRPHVVRAINGLLKKKVITKNGNSGISKYSINKDYSKWEPLPKKATTYLAESSIKNFCYICNYDKSLIYHHIVHQSAGGSDRVENLIRLCPNCHSLVHKGEYTEEYLITQKGNTERSGKTDCQKGKSALPKKVHTKDILTIDTFTIDKPLLVDNFVHNSQSLVGSSMEKPNEKKEAFIRSALKGKYFKPETNGEDPKLITLKDVDRIIKNKHIDVILKYYFYTVTKKPKYFASYFFFAIKNKFSIPDDLEDDIKRKIKRIGWAQK